MVYGGKTSKNVTSKKKLHFKHKILPLGPKLQKLGVIPKLKRRSRIAFLTILLLTQMF